MSGIQQSGIFYGNSETSHADILDGSSNTIMLGERSGNVFESTWTGAMIGADFSEWRVVGWTGEPPNYENDNEVSTPHFHPFAQFNSDHADGLSMFAFADGSVDVISKRVDFEVFHSLGTINGRERNSRDQF